MSDEVRQYIQSAVESYDNFDVMKELIVSITTESGK
jgi:hypothetical protein